MTEPQVAIEYTLNLEGAERIAPLKRVLTEQLPEQVATRTLAAVDVNQPVSLSLVITDDDEIQALNRQYRQLDKPTDVLSFPLLDQPLVHAPAEQLWMPPAESPWRESSTSGENIQHPHFVTPAELETNLGDIVISWPTVVRQATQAGHEAIYELLYLLSHGVLHLVGYDDQTEEGYAAMVHLQERVMQAIPWSEYSA